MYELCKQINDFEKKKNKKLLEYSNKHITLLVLLSTPKCELNIDNNGLNI